MAVTSEARGPPSLTMETRMKRALTIALAALSLGGAVVATAAPADARDWGHHDRGGHDNWREHDGWRDRGGWRHDRNWNDGWRYRSGAFYFGIGQRCHTSWRWNPYWGRNVKVTRCY